MIRQAVSVAVALLLYPALVRAQATEFTINTASASVYKAPSTGSPVIGTAPRGTVLKVTRELGSWVKVSWPGPNPLDDAGYVHLSMGMFGRGTQVQPTRATVSAPARPSTSTAAPVNTSLTSVGERAEASGREPAERSTTTTRTVYVRPPTHIVGLGAQMAGAPLGFGATMRTWPRERLGIQFEVTRDTSTSALVPETLTTVQFVPSVLYSFKNKVSDYFLLRPYIGTGVHFDRHTLNGGSLVPGSSVSESTVGLKPFGGAEVTFASMPRFAVSVDFGYEWAETPGTFTGFDIGGPSVAISGHWYVK
jgi:uncharacterized protein YraI